MFGGIEAGGTKIVCAVGTGPDDLRDEIRFPTTSPDDTFGRIIEYFSEQNKTAPISAIGIATFGPVDLDKKSATFGYITPTTKPGWTNANFYGSIKNAFNVPVGIDTDVNIAGYGEYKWGAAKNLTDFLYLTIGTGIGGGGFTNGKMMHGLQHPEMGHILIPQDKSEDPFEGNCPYHKNCFEGLAAGPAIADRWGKPAQDLEPDHPAWELEAKYISFALVNYILTLSPQRIILGGGVMDQEQILPMIMEKVKPLLGGYVQNPSLLENISDYIVKPALGNKSGILGAIALAEETFRAEP